jgi:hypothetical protein
MVGKIDVKGLEIYFIGFMTGIMELDAILEILKENESHSFAPK